MKYISIILSFVLITVTINSYETLQHFGNIQLALPEGWSSPSDRTDFPYHVTNNTTGAELLIFKSILEKSEAITSNKELKLSVDAVVDNFILNQPEAKLLTSSGYFESNRVHFDIEFTSLDTVSNIPLWHRLTGYIYEHPDGHQFLFTLWGQCPLESMTDVKSKLTVIQSSFIYSGPAVEKLFSGHASPAWFYMGALAVLIICLVFFKRRQLKIREINISDNKNFWRCQCGRLNHNSHDQCRWCGNTNDKQVAT